VSFPRLINPGNVQKRFELLTDQKAMQTIRKHEEIQAPYNNLATLDSLCFESEFKRRFLNICEASRTNPCIHAGNQPLLSCMYTGAKKWLYEVFQSKWREVEN
jgi:hypothetical protein